MSEREVIYENIGIVNKVGKFMGKAVDMALTRAIVGKDPLDFEPEKLSDKQKAKKIEELIAKGSDQISDGSAILAHSYMKAAHNLDPQNQAAVEGMLLALCNTENSKDEIMGLREESKLIADDSIAREMGAVIAMLSGDVGEATDLLQPLLESESQLKSFEGRILAARFLGENDACTAKKYVLLALEFIPDSVQAHRLLKECHEKLGEVMEAQVEAQILALLD